MKAYILQILLSPENNSDLGVLERNFVDVVVIFKLEEFLRN